MKLRFRILFSALMLLLVSGKMLAQSSSVLLPPDTVNPTCFGLNNGSIEFNFVGDSTDFFFSWSGGNLPTNGNPVSGDGLIMQSGLRAGDYFIFIQDNITGFDTTIFVSLKNQRTVAVSAGNDINNCLGQPVNLTATSNAIPGSIFLWSYTATGGPRNLSGQTASIPPIPSSDAITVSGPVTVVVTDPAGCTASNLINVTVNVPPIGFATPDTQRICPGLATITLTGNQPGTTFTWTVVRSGGIIGATAGSGLGISQNVRPSGLTQARATYNIRPVSSVGCVGPLFTSVVIVKPKPIAGADPDTVSVCSGNTTSINLTSNLANTSYSWRATGDLASGFSDGSGGTIAQILTATSNGNGTVRYRVVGEADGCKSDSFPVLAFVKPVPLISVSPSDTIALCPNQAQNIEYSSDVASAAFSWTVAANGTGVVSGSGSSHNQIYQNAGNTVLNADFSAIAVANGCTSLVKEHRVKVFPKPVIEAIAEQDSICSGDSVRIQLVSNLPGTIFTWTSTASAASGNGSGNTAEIRELLTASSSSIGSVTYTITGSTPDCPGVEITKTIFIKPRPDVSVLPERDTLCSGESTSIALSASIPGSVINWTALGNGLSGVAAGSGNLIAQTLSNLVPGIDSAIYTVQATFRSCPGTASVATVLVQRSAAPVPSDPAPVVCSGTALNISLSPDASWNWLLTAGSAAGAASGSGTSFQQTILNSTNSNIQLMYRIFGNSGRCTTDSLDLPLTVKPLPRLSLTVASDSICAGANAQIDISSQPSDNVNFSWTAIPDNVLGASSGAGAQILQSLSLASGNAGTVSYLIRAERQGCTDSTVQTIFVSNPDIPVALNQADSLLCNGDSLLLPLVSSLDGISFSWTVATNNVSGAVAGSGNEIRQQLSLTDPSLGDGFADYTITPSFGVCTGIPKTKRIFVNSIPDVPAISVLGGASPICPGDSLILSSSASSNNQWTRNGLVISSPAGTSQIITVKDSGNYSVSFTSQEGCSAISPAIRVDIRPVPPQPVISGPAGFCNGTSAVLTSSAGSGNQWQLNGADISSATDSLLTTNQAGIFSIRLTNSICPVASENFTLIEFPNPVQPQISGSASFCEGDTIILTSSAPAKNLWLRNDTILAGQTGINLRVSIGGSYRVQVSDSNNCTSISEALAVNALPSPVASVITGPLAICEGGTATLSASLNQNYQWLFGDTAIPAANQQQLITGNFGVYRVVTNLGTCTDTSAGFTLIQEQPDFSIDTTINPANCFAPNTGSISLSVQGGSGSFSFAWSPSALPATASQDSLLPGTYAVRITDLSTSCLTNLSIVVPAAPQILAGASLLNDSRCDLDNGSISINAAGSPGPFGFEWTGRNETSAEISNLSSGTYEVTITDSSTGCVKVLSDLQIGAVDTFSLSASVTGRNCQTAGSIIPELAGGSGEFGFSWSGNGSGLVAGASSQNNLSSGTYQLFVLDSISRCSRSLADLVIVEDTALNLSVLASDPSACNAADGSALVSANRSGAVYTWLNSAGQIIDSDSIAAGLSAGSYKVRVQLGFCLDSASISLQNPVLNAALSAAQINGCNQSNGSITVQLSNAVLPAAFSWKKDGSPFSSSENLSNLSGGVYQLVVLAAGCTDTVSATVQDAGPFTFTPVLSPSSSCLSSDGSIQLNTSGNNTNLNFVWSRLPQGNPAGGDSARLASINSGWYKVLISNGFCSDSAEYLLPSQNQGNLQDSIIPPAFCGASNGSIFLADSASLAGQSARWFRDGEVIGQGFSIQNLSPGTYQLLLSNNLLGGPLPCEQVYSYTMPAGSGIGLNAVVDSANCSGLNGSASISAASGLQGLSFSWTKTGDPLFSATGSSQNNLGIGTYKVFVSGPSCNDSLIIQVPQSQNCDTNCSTPVLVFEVQPSGCSSADGLLIAAIPGNTQNTSFAWFSLPGNVLIGTDDSLQNIPAGLYKVQVLRGNCVLEKEYLLKKSPLPFSISSSKTDATCANNDGSVQFSLSNAGPGLGIKILSLSSGQQVSDTLTAANLSEGFYRLIVQDGSCTDSADVEIKKPAFCGPCALVAQGVSTPASCPGAEDGRAFAVVTSGGTGPYQFILNGSDTLTQAQFLQSFPNQPSGPFTIIVQDLTTGCRDTVSDFIGSQFALTAAVNTLASDCDTSGSISISLNGAAGPYTLILTGDTLISGADTIRTSYSDTLTVQGLDTSFSGIRAGAYKIQVRSAAGCLTEVDGILLRLRTPVFVRLGNISPATCSGNGSIRIDSLAGSDSYKYFIPGQMTDFAVLTQGSTINGLPAGNYVLRITGNRSCDLDTNILIPGSDSLQFSVAVRSKSLCSDSSGSAKLISLSGGNGGPFLYSLQRNGLNFRNDTLAADSVITGLPAGIYRMQLQDAGLCNAETSFRIEVQKLSYSISLSADTNKICSLDSVTFTAGISPQISSGINFRWYLNNNLLNISGPLQKIGGLLQGDSVYVVAEADTACFLPDSIRSTAIVLQVTPSGAQVLAGISGIRTIVCSGSQALLQADNSNQIPDVQYSWLVNGVLQNSQNSEFLAYVPAQPSDTVQAIITALSGTGCLLSSADTSEAQIVTSIPAALVKDSIELTSPGDSVFLCANTPVSFQLGSSLSIPYSVEWYANGVRADSGQNNNFTFNGLSGNVRIRAVVKFDSSFSCLQTNGLPGVDSSQIFELNFLQANDPRCLPCALQLTAQVQNLSCAATADGKITASVSGGTGAYLFSLSPGGSQNSISPVFAGLLPGIYSLSVKDTITGCTDTLLSLSIVSQNNYAVSLAFENSSSCTDTADGKIEVISVADGSGDDLKYLFSLSPGYPAFSPLRVFENLLPDTFLLQIKDTITGCITGISRIISRKDPVDGFVSLASGVSCNGLADGAIRLDSVRNGSGLYQISFSGDPGSFEPVQPGDTIGGFSSGNLFVYIRDFKTGCLDSNFIFVPQPAPLSLSLNLVDSSSCVSSTGKVKVGPVSGGTSPYAYLVKYPDSANFQPLSLPADSILSNLGGGTLLLTVTDSKNCSLTNIIEIPVDRPVIGQISLTRPCIGDSNGVIRLTGMSGGAAPYSFTLLNGFGQTIVSQSDSVFSNLPAGTYSIAIKDSTGAIGCENLYTRQLLPTEPLRFTLAKFVPSTCNNFDGEAVFAISGGQRPYRYSFDSLAGQFTSYAAVDADDTLKLRGLSARAPGAFYTLRILDKGPDGGCSYDTTFIQPGQAPLQYQISRKNITCFGETSGSVTLSNIRGTGPLVVRVRRVGSEAVIAFDTLEGSFFQNSTFTLGGLPSGNFNLEVKQFGECSGSRSIPFSISEPEQIRIFARNFRKSAPGFQLGSILLDSVNGGFQPYLIRFAEGAAFTYKADSLFRKLNPGTYKIIVRDSSGCEVESEVDCEEETDLVVPNLFTPNGDDLNDRFEIRNLPAGCRLVVKDRWGKEVFESDSYQNSWDGKNQDPGTYFWHLEIPGQEGKSGWVELQR